MRQDLGNLIETHLIGPRCREAMLDSGQVPALRSAHVSWVGHSVLHAPYRMIRPRSPHSHLVVSLAGEGRAWIEGAAVRFAPGQALFAPVGMHHAYEIAGRRPWRIAWAFYDDREDAPALAEKQPRLGRVDGEDFVSVVRLLTRENSGAAKPAAIEALVTLLDTTLRRLTGSEMIDARLARLWEKVETNLAHDWSVAEMARAACMSAEHLRRLSQLHHRCSPAVQLTGNRMRRASLLLRSTSSTIDEIALRVGYGSMYSFSAAFRRWSGVPPAQFRRRSATAQPGPK